MNRKGVDEKAHLRTIACSTLDLRLPQDLPLTSLRRPTLEVTQPFQVLKRCKTCLTFSNGWIRENCPNEAVSKPFFDTGNSAKLPSRPTDCVRVRVSIRGFASHHNLPPLRLVQQAQIQQCPHRLSTLLSSLSSNAPLFEPVPSRRCSPSPRLCLLSGPTNSRHERANTQH